jgi:folate-binding protein YgfZ
MKAVTSHRTEHSRQDLAAGTERPGDARELIGYEGYDAARTGAVVYERGARGLVALEGRDVVLFLHGILTNDILALQPGQACYAAYLTPQGRMIADMEVLRTEGGALIDVEPEVRETLVQRFDQSIFTEDVHIVDRSSELASLGVYGPSAGAALQQAGILGTAGLPGQNDHVSLTIAASEVIVLGTQRAGVTGVHLFAADPIAADLRTRLRRAGTIELGALAAESLRIEAGVPRFGTDMTSETIPLEAGIEDRAISMTKGCYVGQEVIVRILHRGHGRVARRLVGFRMPADPAPAGTVLVSAEKPVGHLTSSVRSPRFGAIGLGYVQRDFTEPGTQLRLANASGPVLEVSALPFTSA